MTVTAIADQPVVAATLLATRGLSKRFGGTKALSGVDFDLVRGEIHALLGENGAGKSTFIKILAGIYAADAGTVDGPRGRAMPGRAVPGLSFVHQDRGLVETMTVSENIAIGTRYARRRGLIDWRSVGRRAARALDMIGCSIEPATLVGRLSAAEKSMVAIARALAVDAEVLILDEPTATLPEADVAHLHDVLRRVRERGLGILYVTHRLDEVFRLADRATVFRDGVRRSTRRVCDTTPAALVTEIVGRHLQNLFPEHIASIGRPLLGVEALCSVHVGPASFHLRTGEILGLVGLRGAGHDVVGRMIGGDIAARSGTIVLDGRTITIASPEAAIAAGIGFVSSKRLEEGIGLGLTLRENVFINPWLKGLAIIGTARERRAAAATLSAFDVRPPQPDRIIATLSGGNQQKVVLARWLGIGCRLLVLEEPTIGVDIGAKTEIYRLLVEALEHGLAAILVSSDFEEVAGLCDRAIVFSRGHPVAEVERADLSVARLTALASGASI
jgi:ribose transport system ATP-binding protein